MPAAEKAAVEFTSSTTKGQTPQYCSKGPVKIRKNGLEDCHTRCEILQR